MINLQKKKPSFEEMSINALDIFQKTQKELQAANLQGEKELQEQLTIIEEAKAKKENILSIQATNDNYLFQDKFYTLDDLKIRLELPTKNVDSKNEV